MVSMGTAIILTSHHAQIVRAGILSQQSSEAEERPSQRPSACTFLAPPPGGKALDMVDAVYGKARVFFRGTRSSHGVPVQAPVPFGVATRLRATACSRYSTSIMLRRTR